MVLLYIYIYYNLFNVTDCETALLVDALMPLILSCPVLHNTYGAFGYLLLVKERSRLTIVSREAKKKCTNATTE